MYVSTVSIDKLFSTDSVTQTQKTISSVLEGVAGAAGTNQAGETRGVSVNISKLTDLISKLEELQQEDPEKYKELLSSAAEKLRSAAAEIGDDFGSKMLTDLADKMEAAAETGDVSSLLPAAPPPPPAGTGNTAEMEAIQQYKRNSQVSLSDVLSTCRNSESSVRQTIASVFDEIYSALSE